MSKRRLDGGQPLIQDMLSMMMSSEIQTENGDVIKSFSEEEIVSQAVSLLSAGQETVAAAMSFLIGVLSTHPEVQARLHSQIDSLFLDEDDLNYENIQNVPYFDQVLYETLRMYPPVYMLTRRCVGSCTLGGINIARDTAIHVPLYSIHHDPKLWKDPEKFDPNRFLEASREDQDPLAFLPFGTGARNCIGMKFALTEIKYVLLRLLMRFKFLNVTDTSLSARSKNQTTLTPKDGILVTVIRRVPGG